MGGKLGRGLCPLFCRAAGSPSSTMWPGPRPTSMPSAILIHPAVWPTRHEAKIGGSTPFLGRGSWAYLHAKFHLDASNRLATVHQTYRHDRQTDRQTDRLRSDSIGRIVLQTVAQKCAKAFGHDGATYAVRQNQLSHIHVIHRTRKTVERLEVR